VTGASLFAKRIDDRGSHARHMPDQATQNTPQGADIRLRTLGKAALVSQSEGTDTEILGPGKPLALLVYLSRSPQQSASRDHLLDLLWADHAPDAARHALRQAVWYLRKRLGDAALEAGDGHVRLTRALQSDVSLFETAIEEQDLAAAVTLYGGSFLPEMAVPGGVRFEQWADSQRVHLQSLFFRAADVVVDDWLSEGRTREARELSHRVRDANPLDEVGWRLLLETLCSAGDWVSAGVEAEALERMLARENRQPEPATRSAIETAKRIQQEPGEQQSDTLVAELIGREREFATVTAAWQEAQRGPGVHLHITGAAGIGKTRLLKDLEARLLTMGARVVYVNANPGTRHVAYSYASDLAEALCRLPGAASVSPACASILVGLNPTLSSIYDRRADAPHHDVARKHLIAVRDLLAGVADEQPLAVFVDDLHWVDQPSLSLLAGLIGSVPDSRVLLVTTSRPMHDALQAADTSRTIELEPLTQDQVLSLLSSLGSLPDEAWTETLPELIHSATRGSPLLTMETLQLALEQERLGLEQGEWTCSNPTALQAELHEGGALKRRIAELKREQSWLLLLLAAAGTPLSRGVLAELVNRPGASFDHDLLDLERKGFIARAGEEYRVAHDEIAELAVESAPNEASSAAFGAIGRVLLDYGWNDLGLLTQAGPYLARAGDVKRLRTAFRRKVWLARSRGDRRSLIELARETTGTMGANGQASKLVKRLPLYMRLGLSSPRRAVGSAAVAAMLVIGGIAMLLVPNGPPADMNFMLFERGYESTRLVFVAELRREGWDELETVEPSRKVIHRNTRFSGRHMGIFSPSPDGTMWAISHLSGDTGGSEVFVSDGRASEKRLTFASGDDKPGGWSPDGRQLSITTARWSDRSIYELAILNVNSTGVNVDTTDLERLTYTEALELYPTWSPDGTRIAFMRQGLGGTRVELCWITVDGTTSSCFPAQDLRISKLMTWSDDGSLLLLGSDSTGERWMVSLLPESGRLVAFARVGSENKGTVSPDSKWGACYCTVGEGLPSQWRIFPLDDPTQSKPVRIDYDNLEGLTPMWQPTHESWHYLERIEVQGPVEAPVGVPLLMRLTAKNNSEQPTVPQILEWTSLDTNVAAVDPGGVINGKRTGEASIAASAGGWRADSVIVRVVEPESRLVLKETWTDNWAQRWASFGDPTPRVVVGPDSVAAFWNANDEKYTSGAYSRSEWSVTRGFGVEATVSTPITEPDQQNLYVWLHGNMPAEELAGWDHRTGYFPGRDGYSNARCDARIHRDTGNRRISLALFAPDEQIDVTLDLTPGSAQWYRLRLQLFPDGTCGVAIDGRPVARTNTAVPLDATYRVITDGRSFRTQLLVGPLEIWEGVRTDVDWASLEGWGR
jgi:DNA-binding SARP family transcriptional activator